MKRGTEINPYRIDTPGIISFSGGRTSGYMLRMILDAFGGTLPDDIKVVFCNTGKERPETLDFVERCSIEWDVPIVWLEYRYDGKGMSLAKSDEEDEAKAFREMLYVINPGRQKQPGKHTFTRVDYATASRNGEPFEQLIRARNMLPNVVARFCTVELKIRTTNRYIKSLGWESYTNAIGLRADEPHRVAKLLTTNKASREEPIAPLAKAGVGLANVRQFWRSQPFDLNLESHEGNCDLCFLKGERKLRRIMRDRPDLADWWIKQEADADERGIAVNPTVAYFRKDRPPYRVQLELAQRPTLFDDFEPDELSIACHCSD